MGNYAVFLEGENFALLRDGRKELLGFFVTVRVEANSESEAKSNATALVKSNPQLAQAYKAGAKEVPEIEAKVVHQLLPENNMKSTEFEFFPMGEK